MAQGHDQMEEKKTKRSLKALFIFTPLIVVVLVALLSVSMAKTSTTNYCLSCHEMKSYKEELEKSSHAFDKDKNPIECSQCHLPSGVGPRYVAVKIYSGTKDLWAHHVGDPTRLDRRHLQSVARRFLMDDNCLACHQDLYKNVKNEPISEIGKLCHDAYLGKNGETESRCAGCHQNLAHLPEFDRRYLINAKFAAKFSLEKEKK
jgi:nitrate/TMAO reductase-like tetraheme cytochrome c subunit